MPSLVVCRSKNADSNVNTFGVVECDLFYSGTIRIYSIYSRHFYLLNPDRSRRTELYMDYGCSYETRLLLQKRRQNKRGLKLSIY